LLLGSNLLHGHLLLLLHAQILHELLVDRLAIARVLSRVSLSGLRLIAVLLLRLLDSSKVLLSDLEVGLLRILDLSVDAVNFELVGVDLRLIVLQLSHQILQLLATIFQVLLILDEFLRDVGAALLGEDVFELNVELLLLLDEHVLLGDLLGLGNEALLQTLDLLDQLVSLDARRLELAPSVHVQWLLKLVLQILRFLFLLKQFLLEKVNLTLEIRNTLGLFLRLDELALVLLDLVFLLPDIHHFLLIVNLALLER